MNFQQFSFELTLAEVVSTFALKAGVYRLVAAWADSFFSNQYQTLGGYSPDV